MVSGSDHVIYGLGPLYSVTGANVTTYARDGLKSVRAELTGTTTTASWRYRSYGEVAKSFGAATPALLGYAGQLLDRRGCTTCAPVGTMQDAARRVDPRTHLDGLTSWLGMTSPQCDDLEADGVISAT